MPVVFENMLGVMTPFLLFDQTDNEVLWALDFANNYTEVTVTSIPPSSNIFV